MKIFEFEHIQSYLFVAEHDAFVAHGWVRSEEWIYKTRASRSSDFVMIAKCRSCFDMDGRYQWCWRVCAWMNRCTGYSTNLFVVRVRICLNKILVWNILCRICGVARMLMATPISQMRHPRACVALTHCHTLTLPRLKNIWLKKIRAKWKFWFSHSKLFVRCNTWRITTVRWWTVWTADLQNTSFKVHWLSIGREMHIVFDMVDIGSDVGVCALGSTVGYLAMVYLFFVMIRNVFVVWNFLSFACGDTQTLVCSPVGHLRHPHARVV